MTPAGDAATYEVLAVRYGTRLTRRSEVFLHYEVYGEPDAETRMDYFFWVARRPGQTVLIDCGFNELSGARRGRTMLCPPPSALERLGIAPGDVGLLIATHAHYDHIGNLGSFPAAELVLAEREYAFWTGPLASRPLFATSAEAEDIDRLRQAHEGGRIRLVSGRERITQGIDVVDVGGHTPGQLIVLITAGRGEVVIASDALHYYEEMALDRPFAHVTDLPAMYACYGLLRGLAAGGAREIVAGHDPDVMRRFPEAAGETAGLAVRIG
jgi:glyoxylase-like metal-dependent hydrolase (beta-lactamase superfamily II)